MKIECPNCGKYVNVSSEDLPGCTCDDVTVMCFACECEFKMANTTKQNPKAQTGIWELIAPDGTSFKAESPLMCIKKERTLRVPPKIAVKRMMAFLNHCDLCEDSEAKYILAQGTPAEIRVCLTCKNTIFQHGVKACGQEV